MDNEDELLGRSVFPANRGIRREIHMKKLYKCMLTMIAMMLLLGTVSVSAGYRPGSKDDDYQSLIIVYNQGGITAEETTSLIHKYAINGGLSPSVIEDALNRGFCLQNIELYKAQGLIPQDFFPAGTSNETIQEQNSVSVDETKVSENSSNKQEQVKAEPTEEEIAAAWEETGRTESTCTDEGVITYTNSITRESKTESIPVTEHDYVETICIEATCTDPGKVTYACTACKESYEKELPMLEHVEGDWTIVKEAGVFSTGERNLVCSTCGEILQSEEIPQNCPLPIYVVIGIVCVAVVIVMSVIWFVKKRKIKYAK